MSEDLNFVKIKAYDGFHFIRKHLIKSISEYNNSMYLGGEHPVDVKTKILYDTQDVFYFTDNIDTVYNMLKGEWTHGE